MPYLRRNKVGKKTYHYIVKVEQKGGRGYREKVLEALGPDPDPERLEKALRYWKVRFPRDDKRLLNPNGNIVAVGEAQP